MSNEDWLGMDSEATAAINSAPQRPINRAEDARIIDEGVQPLQNGGLIDQSWRNRNVRAVEGEGADIMYRNTLRENERTLTVMERIAEITEDGDINPFTGKRAAITRAGMARIAGKGGNMDEGFDEEEEEPRRIFPLFSLEVYLHDGPVYEFLSRQGQVREGCGRARGQKEEHRRPHPQHRR